MPTCAEDGTHVLKVCQHHHQLVRVAQVVLPSEIEGTSKVQVARDCVGRFGWNLHGQTARATRCLTVQVAGGDTSIRASDVYLRSKCAVVTFNPRMDTKRGFWSRV